METTCWLEETRGKEMNDKEIFAILVMSLNLLIVILLTYRMVKAKWHIYDLEEKYHLKEK